MGPMSLSSSIRYTLYANAFNFMFSARLADYPTTKEHIRHFTVIVNKCSIFITR